MRCATLLGVLTAALLGACGGNKHAARGDRYGSATDSLFLSLERTPCFGMCPAYPDQVYRSGFATYEGISHVEKVGPHAGHVGTDTLKALLDEAERIGFFGLEDKYDGPVTDLPSLRLRIVSGDRDKAILARYKTPRELKAFGQFADSLLVPVPWVPVPPKD